MKKFAKILAFALCLTLFGTAFAACGSDAESHRIEIRGSTSAEPLMEAFMDAYDEVGKYDIDWDKSCTGSGAGVTAADEDSDGVVIGMGSSALSTENQAKVANAFNICLDAIAIIVHKDNPISSMTVAEIYDAFAMTSGKTSWSAFGQTSTGTIHPVVRDAASGTREAFGKLIKNSEGSAFEAISNYDAKSGITISNSTNEVMTTVAGNVNAIGYVSLGSAVGNTTIKVLSVDGVAASNATVLDNTYKLQRPFVFYTTKAALTPATADFLKFLKSSDAQEIVEDEKLVPQTNSSQTAYTK